MARRVTMDMSAERAQAWQQVIAADPTLKRQIAVFVIRESGQVLPVGAANIRSPLLRDADNSALQQRTRRREDLSAHIPRINRVGEVLVPRGYVGCEFISEPMQALDGVRVRVQQLMEQSTTLAPTDVAVSRTEVEGPSAEQLFEGEVETPLLAEPPTASQEAQA